MGNFKRYWRILKSSFTGDSYYTIEGGISWTKTGGGSTNTKTKDKEKKEEIVNIDDIPIGNFGKCIL